MNGEQIVLLLNVASTLFMVGLIWFVQIVHYPLMNSVGVNEFVDYQTRHQQNTGWVVGPPMSVEAITSVLLIWCAPNLNTALVLLALALLFIIWVSTVLLQVPCNADLIQGLNSNSLRKLELTNWLRTICWTIRGALVCWFVCTSNVNLAI